MNKNKIISGGDWGWRGREVGREGEGSGGKETGNGDWVPPCPPVSLSQRGLKCILLALSFALDSVVVKAQNCLAHMETS